MSDLTTPVSVSCPSQHEPSPLSLISSNHNNSISSIVEDDSIKMSSASHPKSVSVGGDSPLCNGSHVDEDTLENHQHNKVKGESERHTLEQQKCVEKVNGLIHSEYNSEDNRLLVNLLNTCCKEDAESHSGDSGRSSGVACQCTEGECEEKSCNELKHNAEKSSPKVHCDVKHNDVDKLLSELEKASLDQHSSSSDHLTSDDVINGVTYVVYESEKQMPDIMRLITKDLSEPYSIYTYRYFIHNWPKLCFLAMVDKKCVGAIVCKLDLHKKMVRRGYIAMLAVDSEYRRRQIGSTLVTKAIEAMIRDDCDEVVLETEITNQGALRLYENLGFVRDKRLFRYYLNGVDALRLKLWLR